MTSSNSGNFEDYSEISVQAFIFFFQFFVLFLKQSDLFILLFAHFVFLIIRVKKLSSVTRMPLKPSLSFRQSFHKNVKLKTGIIPIVKEAKQAAVSKV